MLLMEMFAITWEHFLRCFEFLTFILFKAVITLHEDFWSVMEVSGNMLSPSLLEFLNMLPEGRVSQHTFLPSATCGLAMRHPGCC